MGTKKKEYYKVVKVLNDHYFSASVAVPDLKLEYFTTHYTKAYEGTRIFLFDSILEAKRYFFEICFSDTHKLFKVSAKGIRYFDPENFKTVLPLWVIDPTIISRGDWPYLVKEYWKYKRNPKADIKENHRIFFRQREVRSNYAYSKILYNKVATATQVKLEKPITL